MTRQGGPGLGRAGHPGVLKGSPGLRPCLALPPPPLLAMAESAKLQLFVKVPLGWEGSPQDECALGGSAFWARQWVSKAASVPSPWRGAQAALRRLRKEGPGLGEGPVSCPQGCGGADSQLWLRDPAQPSWRKSPLVGRCPSGSWWPGPKWSLRSVQQERGAGPGDRLMLTSLPRSVGPRAGAAKPRLPPHCRAWDSE